MKLSPLFSGLLSLGFYSCGLPAFCDAQFDYVLLIPDGAGGEVAAATCAMRHRPSEVLDR